MTDTVDLLIRTRFDAVANASDDRDWSDVLARAQGREFLAVRSPHGSGFRWRVPARVALVAAVVALAAVVTAVAFGWPQRFVDFFSSAPAPTGVKNFMGSMNVGAPPGMDPRAIPGQTRRIVTLRFKPLVRGGRPRHITLYVAPTKRGGFCEDWTGASGGCVSPTTLRGSGPHGGYGDVPEFGSVNLAYPYPNEVDGVLLGDATRTLEARFADGTTAKIPVTWVSAPINAGFYLYPVPRSHWNRAHAIRSVVALDADGRVIGKDTIPQPNPIDDTVQQTLPDGTTANLPRRAEAAKAREIISFRATDGSKVGLWLMPVAGGGFPLRGGGICTAFATFSQGGACVVSRGGKPEQGFYGQLHAGLHRILLFLQSGPDVAKFELRYQNGERGRLTPIDGFVLHELGPAHWKRGTRLAEAIALNRAGRAIGTQRFDTQSRGLYPCKKPVALRYGGSICP